MNTEIKPDKVYKLSRTLWKAALAGIVAIGGGTAVTFLGAVQLPETYGEFTAAWPAFVLALIVAAAKGVENYRKNGSADGKPLWEWGALIGKVLPFGVVLFAVGLTSCVTTRFSDTLTKTDGSSSTVTYLGLSTAWPFAKLDSGVHDMSCQFGQAKITIGQKATGMDNTAMAAGVETLIKFIGEQAVKAAATTGVVVP